MQASKQHPVKFVRMLGAKRRHAAGRGVRPATIAIQNMSLLQALAKQSKPGASVELTTQNALSFSMPRASAGEPIFHSSSIPQLKYLLLMQYKLAQPEACCSGVFTRLAIL